MEDKRVTKAEAAEHLGHLIGFIESMEAVVKNPYASGLKNNELLADIKAYVKDSIELINQIEEAAEPEASEPNEKAN